MFLEKKALGLRPSCIDFLDWRPGCRKKKEEQRKELLKQADKARASGKLPAGKKQWWELELENANQVSDDDDREYFQQEVGRPAEADDFLSDKQPTRGGRGGRGRGGFSRGRGGRGGDFRGGRGSRPEGQARGGGGGGMRGERGRGGSRGRSPGGQGRGGRGRRDSSHSHTGKRPAGGGAAHHGGAKRQKR